VTDHIESTETQDGPVRVRTRISVRELARRVGVSTATVSRALNNHPEVSPETRARVLAVADEEGYQFRVGKRFVNVIGLVYPHEPVHPDDGNFESAMLSGILRGVNELRFDVQVINVERDKSPDESYTQFFRRKGLRGVIVRSIQSEPLMAESIADENFPCVLIADRSEHPNVNFVQSDSGADSSKVVDHLVHLGHQRIGIAMHTVLDSDHRDRRDGFLQGLARHGIEPDESLMLRTGGTMSGGTAAIDRFLALEEPPTAIYCTTPPATMGALYRCLQLGVRVPQDLSIVGVDDSTTRLRAYPNYTAVCQDAAQLGLEAARWLSRTLEGLSMGPLRERRPTHFVPGESTGIAPPIATRMALSGQLTLGGTPNGHRNGENHT